MQIFKYQSCENIFLIIDKKESFNYSLLALSLCSKYKTDGLLFYDSNTNNVLIFNSDGSEANMCGNGLKSLMHYCFDKNYHQKKLKFNTKSGIYETKITFFNPVVTSINLKRGSYYLDYIKKKHLINGRSYELSIYLLGVLHAVIVCDDFELVAPYSQEIQDELILGIKPNINFVKIIDKNSFEIISYERGAGWTKSCATGTGASAYILNKKYELNNNLIALTPGGIIKIEINDNIILSSVTEKIGVYEEEV